MTSTADLKENAETTSLRTVKLDVDAKGIATITIDLPGSKVNTLGSQSMTELNELLDKCLANSSIKGLIICSGKEDNFVAGADVTEIRKLQREPQIEAYKASQLGKEVFAKIEKMPCPVVAAIKGICLGGGTELVLSCKIRLAADNTKIGLPEVKLGLIPGWGGCIRLPRLVGLQRAIELICGGKILDARSAWKARVIDEVVEPEKLMLRAQEIVLGAHPHRHSASVQENAVSALLEHNPVGLHLLESQAAKMINRETKGKMPAPKEALRVMLKSIQLPEEKAYDLEAATFSRLAVGDVSKNLVGIFFAQTESKKLPADITEKPKVKTIGVLGAGVMGAGIAQAAAKAGYKVVVKDVEDRFLEKGKSTISGLFNKLVDSHKMTREKADNIIKEMVFTTSYDALSDCDLVIEAVLEELKVKQEALAECDKVITKPYTFASNTSSLSIDKIAQGTSDPSKIVGLHFFNPVHKMPLVEIVRGAKTSSQALAAAMSVGLKLDKTTVIVKDSPGFVVNRILAPYLREAALLVGEGVPVEDIDRAMKSFGMPMGPLALLDEIGLDVSAKVIHVMYEALGERMSEPPLLKEIERLKLLGKKGGKGIYLYDEKGKIQTIKEGKKTYSVVNPDLLACVKAQPQKRTPGDIQDRLVLLMLNEAVRCMEEGIVCDPSQLDLAMIFGTGYPPFQGGILKYADASGVDMMCRRLEYLARVIGPRYEPCKLLREMAEQRRTFYGSFSPAKSASCAETAR